jgi:hypothetical protein
MPLSTYFHDHSLTAPDICRNLLHKYVDSTGSLFSVTPDKQIFAPFVNSLPHLSALCNNYFWTVQHLEK